MLASITPLAGTGAVAADILLFSGEPHPSSLQEPEAVAQAQVTRIRAATAAAGARRQENPGPTELTQVAVLVVEVELNQQGVLRVQVPLAQTVKRERLMEGIMVVMEAGQPELQQAAHQMAALAASLALVRVAEVAAEAATTAEAAAKPETSQATTAEAAAVADQTTWIGIKA